MKPLSELEKAWQEIAGDLQVPPDSRLAFSRCADELQAWLREVDNGEPPTWFVDELYRLFPDDRQLFTVGNALWRKIHHELLGTTRRGGEVILSLIARDNPEWVADCMKWRG